ncbi:MAG TPA: CsbD family protein [Atopostipes sp.]|nr:CsbD family protein [Atopostipes sp.]
MANMEEIKGKINQASGELTDDQVQKLKGHVQESVGKGKSSGDDMMQKLSREINEMIEDFKRKNR